MPSPVYWVAPSIGSITKTFFSGKIKALRSSPKRFYFITYGALGRIRTSDRSVRSHAEKLKLLILLALLAVFIAHFVA